jgi:hypothetical protein
MNTDRRTTDRSTRGRRAAAALAAVATAAASLLASAGTAAVATTPEVDIVAVTGLDGGLWVRQSGSPTYEAFGGQLVDAPSIAVGGFSIYFFGVGTDGNVWVRSPQDNWAPFGPAGTECTGASAVVSGTDVAVACRGGDGQAWVAQAAEPQTGLPAATSWRPLGGQVLHGVSIADVSEDGVTPQLLYAAVGTDAQVYVRIEPDPWLLVGGRCTAAAALNEIAAVLGCRGQDGAVWVLENDWGSYGGAIVGKPGLAWHEDGRVHAYVLGADGYVWMRVEGTRGWAPFGGQGRYGVDAVTVV